MRERGLQALLVGPDRGEPCASNLLPAL